MSYEVLEVVALPVMEERVVWKMSDGTEVKDFVATGDSVRFEPGGKDITKNDFQKARQSEEQIAHLIEIKAIRDRTS